MLAQSRTRSLLWATILGWPETQQLWNTSMGPSAPKPSLPRDQLGRISCKHLHQRLRLTSTPWTLPWQLISTLDLSQWRRSLKTGDYRPTSPDQRAQTPCSRPTQARTKINPRKTRSWGNWSYRMRYWSSAALSTSTRRLSNKSTCTAGHKK